MSRSSRLLVPLVLGLAVVAGCGGSPDRATTSGATVAPAPDVLTPSTKPAPQDRSTQPAAPEETAPAPAQSTPAFAPSRNAFVNRCRPAGDLRRRLERLAPRTGKVVDEASGSRLPVTVAGRGDTVLVALHDETGDACAARELLAAAGGDPRFTVIAVDLCTSAAARCRGELALDDVAQTGLVLDRVRASYRPAKVVVLGVGHGGATAVRAAAVGLPADAVVNVSGAPTAAELRRVTVPMLHVHDDPSARAAAAARTLRREGGRAGRIEEAPASGWAALTASLSLTRTGADVLDFAAR